MKQFITFLFIGSSILFFSCKSDSSVIRYEAVNEELVLLNDLEQLHQSDDPVSQHVDSILNGQIAVEFISTGQKAFDLNGDLKADLGFEIMDLNACNQARLPTNFDSLAAAVIPYNVQILDNSTYGYADALIDGELISDNSKWSSTHCILGTFGDAGQFKGSGNRFLGFRFVKNQSYQYGWVKLNCSESNDTLKIVEFAYNHMGGSIIAGQTD